MNETATQGIGQQVGQRGGQRLDQRVGQRIARALGDPNLRRALKKATDSFRGGRKAALPAFDEWEAMRRQAAALRAHTIKHLDYYLEQLVARVRENGGHVHFAATDAQAVEIVRNIARAYNVRRVAKSKSMVSEEIGLNAALEADGVEVVETDLGEYIIQLAHETPSHIVGPALHKNREEIAALFEQVEGRPLSSDTPTLTAFAREKLREAFLTADMGITGCNFAVAETGQITLVTNEGNGRMVTALPRVQVTLMGMERIVPRLEDLDLLLTLLTRSATGQKSTSYVTVTTGLKGPGEKDGPEAFHLVIVDNQRSELVGSDFEEALNCIRCGACLNICPVYRHIGGHAYGSVYSGPIGVVLTPLLKGVDEWGELAQASSLCGACDEVCPVKIPLHDLIVGIREQVVERKRAHWLERFAFRAFGWTMANANRYRSAQRLGRWLGVPFVKEGRLNVSLPPLTAWTKHRTLPPVARESFRDVWRRELSDEADPRADFSAMPADDEALHSGETQPGGEDLSTEDARADGERLSAKDRQSKDREEKGESA